MVIDACKSSGLIFKFDLKIPARQVPELVRLFESISAEDRLITSANESIQRAPDGSGNVARIKDLIVFGQLPTGNYEYSHFHMKLKSFSRKTLIPFVHLGNVHVVATIDPHSWEM